MAKIRAVRRPCATGARWVVVMTPVLVLCACGESEADPEAPPENGLVFTQTNGRTTTITPSAVECVPSEYDPQVQVVRVRDFGEDYNLLVEVVPADVTGGKSFDLPVSAGDMESGPANAFVFFGSKRFEVSSAQEESTGMLQVTTATCDPVALEMTVDATLDSEYFDGDSLQVKGGLALAG